MASRRRAEPSHFFKVILSSTLEDKKLKIPEKFARIFGDELSTVATIMVPNGRVWQVRLIKDGRKIWFHDGWHDFVQYNSISTGYFLVFKYRKDSNFEVLIFDMTACEIQYPYNGTEPENDKQKSLHQDETEEEDSVEIMDFTTPNPSFDFLKKKASAKCPRLSSTTPSHLNQATPFGSAFVSPKFRHGFDIHSKRCKIEELDVINKGAASGDGVELKKAKHEVEAHFSDKENERTKSDELELLGLLKDMGISVSRTFRRIASRERATAAARLFKPKNPSFMVILQAHNLINCRLSVPLEFGKMWLSRDSKCIKVQDFNGREWPAMTMWYRSWCCIKGLAGLIREKNLDEGDICIFELITVNELLKVSVSYASTK